MKNEGFLNLANIPDYNEEDLFIASQWLWNLPHEEKEKITRKFYRGIVKVSKGDPSHKTFLEIGDESFDEKAKLPRLYEKIYWPCNDQGFKEMILKYQKIYYDNSLYLMNLIGEGLGLGSNYFDHLFV